MFATPRQISLLPLLLLGFSLSACGSIESRRQEAGLDEDFPEDITSLQDTSSRSRDELEELERERLRRGDYAIRVNRTLIYPCRWLRAEDLAQTLRAMVGGEDLVDLNVGDQAVPIFLTARAARREALLSGAAAAVRVN